MSSAPRCILHLDMDAFYASVEELDHPQYRGQPLIVAGLGRRGVVTTASYAARRFGVRSAMPTAQARRLCPDGIYVAPRMARYQQISAQVFAILRRVSPQIEPLSLDEAFLDISASLRAMGPALQIAQRIQQAIANELGLSASIGIAPSKLIAKLASEAAKPAGIREIAVDEVRAFLDPLKIEQMWGVGKTLLPQLHRLSLYTVADVLQFGAQRLVSVIGSFGHVLHQRCLGEDDREVQIDRPDISIGAEETFGLDVRTLDAARTILMQLCERVAARLRTRGLHAGSISVKLRRPDFTTFTRQAQLKPGTDATADLYTRAEQLLQRWWSGEGTGVALRLLGVSLSELHVAAQTDLFGAVSASSRIDQLADAISQRFGKKAITHARAISKPGDDQDAD